VRGERRQWDCHVKDNHYACFNGTFLRETDDGGDDGGAEGGDRLAAIEEFFDMIKCEFEFIIAG
jgi:hypothetical protein